MFLDIRLTIRCLPKCPVYLLCHHRQGFIGANTPHVEKVKVILLAWQGLFVSSSYRRHQIVAYVSTLTLIF